MGKEALSMLCLALLPDGYPCMEEFEQTMLRSCELRGNMLRKTCGVIVGADGRIYLDLASVPDVKDDVGPSTSVVDGTNINLQRLIKVITTSRR